MRKGYITRTDLTIHFAAPDSDEILPLSANEAAVEIEYNIPSAAIQVQTVEPSDLNLTSCRLLQATVFEGEGDTGGYFSLVVKGGADVSHYVSDECWHDWRQKIASELTFTPIADRT